MSKVLIKSVDAIVEKVLDKCGVDAESIRVVNDTIHFANRRGVATHGVGRLPLYEKKINSGYLNPKDEVELISSEGAVSVFDSKNGFGQVAAHIASQECIKKAKQYGISIVGVRNSNNFGMAGYFGEKIANAGMIALVFANASPAIAPTGGKSPVFGTNPICFAAPTRIEDEPVIMDMAVSMVARGKVRLAAKNNEKIPFDWGLDKEGEATDDPDKVLEGTMLPIGGYKGYGLAMMVDLIAGLLMGSAFGGRVNPLSKMDKESGNGHCFIAIDITKFMSYEKFMDDMDEFILNIKNSGNPENILIPGERGNKVRRECENFINLPDSQIKEINELAKKYALEERVEVCL